jgi:hypothetical protein
MNKDWKVRVQQARRIPYAFKTTFVARLSGVEESTLEDSYLYGEGDLAVLLEDLGAGVPEICRLLETLRLRPTAEILVDVSEEAMEVLARQSRGRL